MNTKPDYIEFAVAFFMVTVMIFGVYFMLLMWADLTREVWIGFQKTLMGGCR